MFWARKGWVLHCCHLVVPIYPYCYPQLSSSSSSSSSAHHSLLLSPTHCSSLLLSPAHHCCPLIIIVAPYSSLLPLAHLSLSSLSYPTHCSYCISCCCPHSSPVCCHPLFIVVVTCSSSSLLLIIVVPPTGHWCHHSTSHPMSRGLQWWYTAGSGDTAHNVIVNIINGVFRVLNLLRTRLCQTGWLDVSSNLFSQCLLSPFTLTSFFELCTFALYSFPFIFFSQ